MQCEISSRAHFGHIRYAQCWEDADVLLAALAVQPGDTCLSIASAGDNTLALLAQQPARVIALDLSSAQLACLELRVAAYRALDHGALLELLGSRRSPRRAALYAECRPLLTPEVRQFWDARPRLVQRGIGHAGKFERYLALFRRAVLPLALDAQAMHALLTSQSAAERTRIYDQQWHTWRWVGLLRLFCSRLVMGRLGRDPAFLAYAEQSASTHLLTRMRHVLTSLDPGENPYVQWILTGRHSSALPYALRPENFAAIRANLDRLEIRRQSLEAFLDADAAQPQQQHEQINCFNLSNVFEYMSPESYHGLLRRLAAAGKPGARLAYWNMLVPRQHSGLACVTSAGWRYLHPLDELAARLHQQDKAFFYRRFSIEEVQA
jgi:S-adenosylmethionine-diacylglycerol 3-amino-3-carboxypropyl transferase